MRVLLINPPYQTLTSNFGVGHQVPLGLLMVGGALKDRGHEVRLLDAECRRLTQRQIVDEVRRSSPHVVMVGHAGSTPAHGVCVETLRSIKAECPGLVTVYGGVYPTYHAARILTDEPAVDIIIRGEGEATSVRLLDALASTDWTDGACPEILEHVPGIAFNPAGRVVITPDAAPIADIDSFRVGWELIEDWDRYTCFGLGRAAIVQFSRGCPHRCTYCGQHGFWVKWRHRDPVRLVDEVERLYRDHQVRFFTLADENPTTLQGEWRLLLEELVRRRLPVWFFATIRATDIVRDAELLPLYREAGILYVLMGVESTNDQVLAQIRKGSTSRQDLEACRLLKRHGIFSILGHIVGFEHEKWSTFLTAYRQLALYDGDYLNAMYVTPHSWTQFAHAARDRRIVQTDQKKWDYRHQVFEQKHLRPWQLFLAIKTLEFFFHFRPRRLWSILRTRDLFRLRQLLWCQVHTGLVWFGEIAEFVFRTTFAREPKTLAEHYPSLKATEAPPAEPIRGRQLVQVGEGVSQGNLGVSPGPAILR